MSLDVKHAGLHDLIDRDVRIERVAGGLGFTEGPVWRGDALLFSDIPNNRIARWRRLPEGPELTTYATGRSNGLTLDRQGHILAAEHGGRRVTRVADDGTRAVLAEKYQGKRLNSPNDVVFRSNGDMYFTDPPYGLPGNWDDPRRELDFCGVFRLAHDGHLSLLTGEMTRPNGLAFSPDETTLYVAQSDPKRAIWMAFPVKADGMISPGRVFADVTEMVGKYPGLPDGMKVDRNGNLFATGPGGVHVFAPDGKTLGRIETGEATANCAWGDDGSTLYIAADMYICRVKTKTKGAHW